MQYRPQRQTAQKPTFDRAILLKALLFIVGAIFIGRLFYVQIVQHDFYQAQAVAEHLKKFEIPASRGVISVKDGQTSVPLVLNEQRYTLFADPKFITDSDDSAAKIVALVGGDKNEVAKKLSGDNRYVILAKKLTKDQVNRIKDLKIKGIGIKETSVRTYPQGSLGAQVVGFVNDDNEGQYGIEGYLNKELSGDTGVQKAITDVNGVPLAVNNDNIVKPAEPGKDTTLTIDIGMQRLVEEKLKEGVDKSKAVKGSALLVDVNTGEIKAMANYPTYDPNQFDKVTDQSLFVNTAITGAWEPGSVLKPLLAGAALNEGKINTNFSYFDTGVVQIADRKITNSLPWGAQTMTLQDILQKSLNTGAVQVLKQLGGGDLNDQGRQIWYDYLVNRYQFGKQTGIEQSGEVEGYLSKPNEGDAKNVRYANMAFGQGLTVTPIQIASAYASLVNGGIYYKPHLVYSQKINGKDVITKPEVVRKDAVTPGTSASIRELIRVTLEKNNPAAVRAGYSLGAKSGTAEIAGPNGEYKADAFNGVYIGYIGGDAPKYVLLVRLDDPKGDRFASTTAARYWSEISNGLIDNFAIPPKK